MATIANAEAQAAAEFIRKVRDELRDSTAAFDPEELLKSLPDVFEQAIALILSELDYERNLECNTAVAVRLLAICAARIKDIKIH